MAGKRGGKGGRRKPARKQNKHGNSEGKEPLRLKPQGKDSESHQNDRQSTTNAQSPEINDPPENDPGSHQRERQYSRSAPSWDKSDPPGDHDADPADRTTGNEDFVDVEHERDLTYERNLSISYSYSSEASDQNDDYQQQRQHQPKVWQEEEANQYQTTLQTQNQTQQYSHDDHAFTQFNIKPLHPTSHHGNGKQQEDDSDSESDEDEEAPLFFSPSNNFNSATDTYSEKHTQGVGWGVDYLQSRASRKERERKERFEIEQQRRANQNKYWWWEDHEDEWDEVDFDNYHSSSFKCRRMAKYIVMLSLAFTAGIAFMARGKQHGNGSQDANSVKSEQSSYHGSEPSSRWGHRFDDDDAAPGIEVNDRVEIVDGSSDIGTPRYHKHRHNSNHSKLTPEDKALGVENWEDYEMEVAHLLADSGPGWDINSKNGGESTIDTAEEGDNYDGFMEHYAQFTDHYVQYYDKSSSNYYYYHRETNTTQWEKPEIAGGVVLLGIAYGTGRDYIIEEGGVIESNNSTSDEIVDEKIESSDDEDTMSMIEEHVQQLKETSGFDSQGVMDHYGETFWRWNHPYRIPERTNVWGGIDTPVFWRIPLSGATTVEEIFTHCYQMIVAGTTGANNDGKLVLSKNITDHLSVVTLDDGAHYLNIDLNTLDGIQKAKKAGLGHSGVADVILTRFLYNSAELFKDTGHTGRCFTILRHPIDRAVALFYNLKRNRAKVVANMTINDYAKSPLAENNWMTRIITNTMQKDLTLEHLNVAKEVFGRKCLVGFVDKNFEESMKRFTKFFKWETVKSVSIHRAAEHSEEEDIEEKRQCASKLIKTGVIRHQYAKLDQSSETWKLLKAKNMFDIELYRYAEALYYKQNVVFETKE